MTRLPGRSAVGAEGVEIPAIGAGAPGFRSGRRPVAVEPTGPLTRAELMKADEVAELLDVDPRTVYGWARTGAIPSVRLSPRVIRFRRGAVAAWIEQNERGHRAS